MPSAGGPAGGRIGEEVGDELALTVTRHRLADDATGGREREVGHLAPQLGDGALALRVDLARRAFAQAGDLLAGGGNLLLAGLRRDLLGTIEDVVGLAPGLLERGLPLLLRRFTVAPGLLGVLQPLLDPGTPVVRGS